MAKPTQFKVTVRSAYSAQGFISSSFKLYGDNPNMKNYAVECTLAELDDRIAELVKSFDGAMHEVRDSDLRDPNGKHIVMVDVDTAKGVRKPPGFNRWDEARRKTFPFPQRADV